jgi:hypothetical protein
MEVSSDSFFSVIALCSAFALTVRAVGENAVRRARAVSIGREFRPMVPERRLAVAFLIRRVGCHAVRNIAPSGARSLRELYALAHK